MRTPLRTLLAALPFLAVFACGGRVGLIDGGDGGKDAGTCPSPDAVVSGSACTTDGLVCSSSYDTCAGTITCACSGGAWACSGAGPSCPPPPPCGVAGQPECPDAQPPGCPAPADVVPGDTCSVDSQDTCSSSTPLYDCSGNFIGYMQCDCFGSQWSCDSFGPDCPDASPPPPPDGCPDPQSVEQGVACFDALEQCAGNPTDCDGAIFYDAFECDNGEWNDVAVTQCDSDGGEGVADAGAGGKGQ
jgi:hypothetical protein